MMYATRRERIEAEKLQLRGRRMRSMKVGVASFATFAGVSVASIAPAHADYTVERGDTLSGIASQNAGVTVSGLMQHNGLSNHLIYPGQNLKFSNSSSTSTTASSTSSSAGTHTVVSGDTLGAIASQHGTTVAALKSANGISSHLIYPGDQLTIPGGSGSSSTSSSASSSTTTTASASNTSTSSGVSTASTGSASTSGVSWAVSTVNSGAASYRYGASGAGNQWDCSGFSQAALAKDGKSIPRSSAAQYASAQKISKSQLRAGDLVFFGNGGVSHVAVYVGNGQIAHARNPSAGLTVNSLDQYSTWSNVIGYGRY